MNNHPQNCRKYQKICFGFFYVFLEDANSKVGLAGSINMSAPCDITNGCIEFDYEFTHIFSKVGQAKSSNKFHRRSVTGRGGK